MKLVPDASKKKPAKKAPPKPKKGDAAEAEPAKVEEPEGPAILQLSYDAAI